MPASLRPQPGDPVSVRVNLGASRTWYGPIVRIVLASVLVASLAPATAQAQHWRDDTSSTILTTAEWTNKVEIADVDGDGWLDILLANGRGYQTPGPAEASRVFRNRGAWAGAAPFFEEITAQVFGTATGHARVIKVRDVDADGDGDVFVGHTYGDASRLYRRDTAGWTDVTATALPAAMPRVGDADFGDVDGDGDLDLVLADWGAGTLATGAPPRLYTNDGRGVFTDATATAIPAIAVKWSWELDLVDVDDDLDLDLLIASKLGAGSFLLRNDGAGRFTDDSAAALPQFTNNYEVEAMDLDGDGDLDLATINDGAGGRNHLFRNDGGRYVDVTDTHLTGAANPTDDDNLVAYLDVDADGDADMIVGSLGGADRLLENDGTGRMTLVTGAIPGTSPGTLGMAVGDLDGDARADLVDGQGETAFPPWSPPTRVRRASVRSRSSPPASAPSARVPTTRPAWPAISSSTPWSSGTAATRPARWRCAGTASTCGAPIYRRRATSRTRCAPPIAPASRRARPRSPPAPAGATPARAATAANPIPAPAAVGAAAPRVIPAGRRRLS
jgi:hypothetical protein